MELIKCRGCLERLPEARFNKVKGTRKTVCRNCHAESCKLYRKKNKERDWMYHRLRDARRRARQKNRAFDLTESYLESMWEKQGGRCRLSGIKLVRGDTGWDSGSLDRIDPEGGYTRDNVQFVSWWCNYSKSNLSVADFKTKVAEVAGFQA